MLLSEIISPRDPIKEAQLNEALPFLLIPALAMAARIGVPAIARALSTTGKVAAKTAIKNPKKTAVAAAAAANPDTTMSFLNSAAKVYNVVKDPKAAAAAMAKDQWGDIGEAAVDIAAIVGGALSLDVVKALAAAAVKHALPIAGVVAMLYGGKKLYDYITSETPPVAPAPVKKDKSKEMSESIISLFEAIPTDREDYGNWTVQMSQKPVVMGKVTGPQAKYVALITHKRKKDISVYGVGTSQAAAREDGLKNAKAKATERSEDPDQFKSFTADLNVDFTRDHLDKDSAPFYKFDKDGENIFLVQASKKYYQAFGREIEQLGFKKASNRQSITKDTATPLYGFPISKNTVKGMGLIPNMRYALKYVNDDEDGNAMFLLIADSRSQGPQDKYRMNTPGVIIAGTLADDINREDAAGVGIITKQNTTGDVNKGSIRKNLKAFKL